MRWRVKVANGRADTERQRGMGEEERGVAEMKMLTKHQENSREKRNN
jgi:hypothetical protein